MKTNLVKRFLKDSSIYSLEPILTKAITFLLIPIYTAYLTPADYGNLQYILMFGAFFTSVIDMGLQSAFWKFKSKTSGYYQGNVVLNVLITTIFISVVIILLTYLLKFLFFNNSILSLFVIVYFIAAAIKKVYETSILILRANFNAKLYVTAATAHATFLLISNFIFIVIFKLKYDGVIYSYLLTAVIASSLFFFVIKKEISGTLNIQLTKKMLYYGVPIMFGNVAAIFISLSDRYFLKEYSTDTELGLYSYGYKFADLVHVLIINTFFLAWNPMRWEIYEMPNGKEIFSKFYKLFGVFLPVAALILISGILFFAPLITVDKSYLEGFRIITIIGFSHVLHGIYYFNAMGMLFENKTSVIMYLIVFSGLVNIVLNILLIPLYGMLGAAIATIISYFVMFLIGRIYSQKYYPIKRYGFYDTFLVSSIFLITFIATFSLYYFNELTTVSFIILGLAVVYLGISFLLKFLDFDEVKSILLLIKR